MSVIGNWDVLDAALEHIITHPDEYDQEMWVCGTTRCVGGWVAYFGGYRQSQRMEDHWVVPPGVVDAPGNEVFVGRAAMDAMQVPSQWHMLVHVMLTTATLTWRQVLHGVALLAALDAHPLPPLVRSALRAEFLKAEEWTVPADEEAPA